MTSTDMKANMPRIALFAATAVDDRPTLESTVYARELEYVQLIKRFSKLVSNSRGCFSHMQKNPPKKRKMQMATIGRCLSQTQPNAMIEGGRRIIPGIVLDSRIYVTI